MPAADHIPLAPSARDRPDGAAAPGAMPPLSHIRLLLVDDQVAVRRGLRFLIEAYLDRPIIREADDGEQAVEVARELRPHVVVMDIHLPGFSGVEATRQIVAAHPRAGVIGFSVSSDDPMIDSMRHAGACAFIPKGGLTDQLCRTILSVYLHHRGPWGSTTPR